MDSNKLILRLVSAAGKTPHLLKIILIIRL